MGDFILHSILVEIHSHLIKTTVPLLFFKSPRQHVLPRSLEIYEGWATCFLGTRNRRRAEDAVGNLLARRSRDQGFQRSSRLMFTATNETNQAYWETINIMSDLIPHASRRIISMALGATISRAFRVLTSSQACRKILIISSMRVLSRLVARELEILPH